MRRDDSLAPALPFDWSAPRPPRMTRAAFVAWLRRARIPFDPQRQAIVASTSPMNEKGWRIVPRIALEPRRVMAKVEMWTHGGSNARAGAGRRA